jgi:ATP-dependent RNA helicase
VRSVSKLLLSCWRRLRMTHAAAMTSDLRCSYDEMAPSAIIFCNTKGRVDWLSDKLRSNSFTVFSVHLSMAETERRGIFEDFLASRLPKTVLITTDLWFCGQPVFHVHQRYNLEHLPLSINYDLPSFPQLYIHRIGAYFHP